MNNQKLNPVQQAQKVLDKYWDGKLPVSMFQLTSKMGINVMSDSFISTSGHYTPAQKNHPPLITFNPTETGQRARFTIAHEIGHHILHGVEKDRNTAPNFTTYAPDPDEVSANQFAAALLIPEKELRALVEDGRIRTLQKLASIFNVSTGAMKYRLIKLGYINE